MADDLKKDMINEFLPEYYAEEKGKRTGFWKALADVNTKIWDGVDWLLNKNPIMKKSHVGFDPAGAILLGTVALFAAGTGVGLLGVGVLAADLMVSAYSNGRERETATARLSKDIDDGLLSQRYSEVLDSRVKGLGEDIKGLSAKIDLYNTQKTQLPAKGAATAAFAAATSEAPAVEAAPAPFVSTPDAPKP
jgi:hypothetical protein